MRITGIQVANVFSFGPKSVFLNDLGAGNLFIGRNGTGKTNALRILGSLPIEFSPDERVNSQIRSQSYTALLAADVAYDHSNPGGGDINISFEDYTGLQNIVFKNGKSVQGNYSKLQEQIKFIEPEVSDSEFATMYLRAFENPITDTTLNFGLFYIFGGAYALNKDFTLMETTVKFGEYPPRHRSGHTEPNTTSRWPSGLRQCTAIILQFIGDFGFKSVFLIDEPEIHLEPRVARKLIRYLLWLCLCARSRNELSSAELNFYEEMLVDYKYWWESGRQRLKRNDMEKMPFDEIPLDIGGTPEQLFIASHSSALIQEFLRLNDTCTVFEFDTDWMEVEEPPSTYALGEYKSLTTTVTRINTRVNGVLNNLGCNGADLLQTNGVVWVEGPSDIIYLTKWIEMYCKEVGIHNPVKGIDYEFQMYGGALLDSLSLHAEELSQEEQYKKLVEMFSFSRNAYVVIDSDAVTKENGVVDNSRFGAAKQLIKRQFVDLIDKGFDLGIWYNERDLQVYSIEDHLDDKTLAAVGKRNGSKVVYARKAVGTWDNNKVLSEFKGDLTPKIKDLVSCIQTWNSYRDKTDRTSGPAVS